MYVRAKRSNHTPGSGVYKARYLVVLMAVSVPKLLNVVLAIRNIFIDQSELVVNSFVILLQRLNNLR